MTSALANTSADRPVGTADFPPAAEPGTQTAPELREEILRLVRKYQRVKFAQKRFSPGKDLVHYAGRVFDDEEMVSLVDSGLDFFLTAGRFTATFEKDLANYLGVKRAFLVNSGSSANLLAVAALTSPQLGARRLKPGDEIITVAAAFPTTVAPLLQHQLVPVFIDVNLGDYTAIPERIAEAVGPRTRGIMMAHTLGVPFDLDTVMRLAREKDLWVIEDNCDALGSRYHGKLTGTFGHLSTISFYPAHHITMGEGGAVVTNDPELARLAISFRDWGRDCYCIGGKNNTCGKRFAQQHAKLPAGYDHKYVYSHIGYNLKATDMQAAIGCAQIKKLEGFVEARKANYRKLTQLLSPFADRLILPRSTAHGDPSWWAYPITVKPDAGFTRNELTAHLESRRIETRNLFSGNLLLHPAFADIPHRVVGDLKNSDLITTNTFFIGIYPGIQDEHLCYVGQAFADFMGSRATR